MGGDIVCNGVESNKGRWLNITRAPRCASAVGDRHEGKPLALLALPRRLVDARAGAAHPTRQSSTLISNF